MRTKLLIFLISLAIGVQAETATPQSDEQQLQHIKLTLWPQAYKTQDVELLSQILHPKFQMIDANGQTTTRAQELDYVKTQPWTAKNFSYQIERLDIFSDNTAVVSGMGETDTYTYHSSNVLIKESGRWQAIMSHVSGFKEKADKAD